MGNISQREFLLRQPSFPAPSETDDFYLAVADRLYNETQSQAYASVMPDGVLRRMALTLTDYLQDIVADAGLWRSFVEANRELYDFSVPFHKIPEDYIDYELNREDVRFLVWYVTAMLWEEKRLIYPHDENLLTFADACFEILESEYDDAPVNESWNLARGLDFSDKEDSEKIYHLGNWLFLHSYLLTPAFAMSLRDIMSEIDTNKEDGASKLNARLEEAMMQEPTGPLALFTPEWVYLMIKGRLPKQESVESKDIHPYYQAFVKATGGEDIKFFDSYESMNEFFITALGWEPGKEHLAQAKGADDYVLMVNRHKGMLMARDIARCIKAPMNPLYNRNYAREHAFELLSERGCCPGDLLHRIFKEGWLPDAHFPDSEDLKLVADNQDFIARCFLQLYYRGD